MPRVTFYIGDEPPLHPILSFRNCLMDYRTSAFRFQRDASMFIKTAYKKVDLTVYNHDFISTATRIEKHATFLFKYTLVRQNIASPYETDSIKFATMVNMFMNDAILFREIASIYDHDQLGFSKLWEDFKEEINLFHKMTMSFGSIQHVPFGITMAIRDHLWYEHNAH